MGFSRSKQNERFRDYQTVVIIDEFGNSAELPVDHETVFGYALSVTEHPDAVGSLTAWNRIVYGGEHKATDDPIEAREEMAKKIAKLRVKTYAFYVDKYQPPKGWSGPARSKVVLRVLDYSLDQVLPKTRGNVFVIVDHHTAYKGKLKVLIESKSDDNRIVSGDQFNSSEGPYSDLLQTHDYVSNSARSATELHEPTRAEILKMKVKRIVSKLK